MSAQLICRCRCVSIRLSDPDPEARCVGNKVFERDWLFTDVLSCLLLLLARSFHHPCAQLVDLIVLRAQGIDINNATRDTFGCANYYCCGVSWTWNIRNSEPRSLDWRDFRINNANYDW